MKTALAVAETMHPIAVARITGAREPMVVVAVVAEEEISTVPVAQAAKGALAVAVEAEEQMHLVLEASLRPMAEAVDLAAVAALLRGAAYHRAQEVAVFLEEEEELQRDQIPAVVQIRQQAVWEEGMVDAVYSMVVI
jgi:hypothetical protein